MIQDIETMLRQLPLAAPGDELDAKVLRRRPRPVARILAVVSPLAAAAAGVLFVLAVTLGRTDPLPPTELAGREVPTPEVAPDDTLRMEANWSNITYGGITTDGEGRPLHTYHTQELRQVILLDEATDSNMVVTIPSENLVLVQAEIY